jgi:hypothetical protein
MDFSLSELILIFSEKWTVFEEYKLGVSNMGTLGFWFR